MPCRTNRVLGPVLLAVGLTLLAGCGSRPTEEDRAKALAADPAAHFREFGEKYLAELARKGGWTAAGAPETKVGPATKEEAGNYYTEGAQLGLLKVKLADRDKKETAFSFVFVSVPQYGTWEMAKVGAVDPATGQLAPYAGNTDDFFAVAADLYKNQK